MLEAFLLGAFFLAILMLVLIVFLQKVAREEYKRYVRNGVAPSSLSVHTYKPVNGTIPLRGWLVLEAGYNLAKKHSCPLILSVGNTGGLVTEACIYKAGAHQRFGTDVQILVGDDVTVRETSGEVGQTLAMCRSIASRRHLVIGLAPHIARIRLIWRKFNFEQNPEIDFLPVYGPWKYWIWEAVMLCLHFIVPPGSRAQWILLNIVRRKG